MPTYEGPNPHNLPDPFFVKRIAQKSPYGLIGDQKQFSNFLGEIHKEITGKSALYMTNYMRAYRNRMAMGFLPEGLQPLPNKPVGINPRPPVKPGRGMYPPSVTNDWQMRSFSLTGRSYGNKPGMIHLDNKSFKRAQMFRKASAKTLERAAAIGDEGSPYNVREHGRLHSVEQADAAAAMHTDARDPRVKRRIDNGYKGINKTSYMPRWTNNARSSLEESRGTHFDSDRGKNTLPYRPAVGARSRPAVPKPSGVTSPPRIAGRLASSILKGTGALGFLPGILHLARGGSLMDLAPPAPGSRTRYMGQW